MEETAPTNTIPLAPHKPAYHYIMYRTCKIYEGWNFNSGNYLFTTDTK